MAFLFFLSYYFPLGADLAFLLLLLLVALARARRPRHAPAVKAVRPWFRLLAFSCSYVLLLQLVLLGYGTKRAVEDRFGPAFYVAAVHALSWALVTVLVVRFRAAALRKVPLPIRLWWVSSFLFSIYTLLADVVALVHDTAPIGLPVVVNFAQAPALLILFVASVRGVTGIDLDSDSLCMQDPLLSEGAEDEEGERQVDRSVPACETITPYSSAGLFSVITLAWMDPLIRVGAKRPLEMDDIPKLPKADRAKTSYKLVMAEWERMKSDNQCSKPNLVLVILQSFKREALVNAVFVLLSTL